MATAESRDRWTFAGFRLLPETVDVYFSIKENGMNIGHIVLTDVHPVLKPFFISLKIN